MTPRHGFDHVMCGPCWADKYHAPLPHYVKFRAVPLCCYCNRQTAAGTTLWTPLAPLKCPERR